VADISIGIASETRAFASGVKSGVLDPLEDVEKALKGVEDASEDAEAELVGGFKGAQRATKDLEREHKELADTIQREARKSSRAIRDIDEDGLEGFRQGVRNTKDEAIQNFSEVASSFDGSMTGAIDGVQGTLGGLASALGGPVGLALGGLGLIAGTVASQWATSAEQVSEDWREMYDDMIASGQNFLSVDLLNQKIAEISQDQGKVNAAVEEGKSIGETYRTVIRAQAGDLTALNDVLGSARGALEEQNAAQDEFIAKNGDESASIADKQGQLELLIAKYERMIGAVDGAAGAANTARQAMDESAAANGRTADSLDRVSDSANGIPSGKQVIVTADTAAYWAAAEAIRRDRLSVVTEFEFVINERRGRTIP
jgi:peptidoglycan hydrolase CwlO-like protein